MRLHRLALLLFAGAALSCGGSRTVVRPLLQEFEKFEREIRLPEHGEEAARALEVGRQRLDEGKPLIKKRNEKRSFPPLAMAVADVRVAWAAGKIQVAEQRADDCRRYAERARNEWENAMILVEQAERSTQRTVAGLSRVLPTRDRKEAGPLPPSIFSGAEPPPGDAATILDRWNAWAEAARDRGIPHADLSARFDMQIDRAAGKNTGKKERPTYLYLAGRAVQELEARVRVEEAELLCADLTELIDRLRESSAKALQASYDLQRSATDQLQAEARTREDEMYSALQQLEGQFARITREARGMIVSLADILFDTGRATLKRDVEFHLVRVATILNQFPEMKIQVEGHTDNVGSHEYNMGLSQRRAQTVRDFLVSQGVDADRMQVEGYGLTRPVASNDTPDGRQKNRRVDLVILEKK